MLEENRDKISHGTTGLVSWQAAVALTMWATESQIFNQPPVRILELGSGLGLFGTTMASLGHDFIATDVNANVLNFLVANSRYFTNGRFPVCTSIVFIKILFTPKC